jgi:recombination protein RecR
MLLPESLVNAVEEFHKFPGIGRKTAQRLALFLLRASAIEVEHFLGTIKTMKDKLRNCSICFNITEKEICEICSSPKRNADIICVVEEAGDIFAIEKSQQYFGMYHVLGGVLSPLAGVNPEDLRVKELLTRLKNSEPQEIILALNPSTEGEATSLYLLKLLKPLGVKVTRIARGIPIGGDIEFTDEITLGKAVTARVELE